MKKAVRGVDVVLTPGDLAVKKVPKKGRGVFATRAFKKGETVEIAPVLSIPEEDYDMIACSFLSSYLFTIGDTNKSALALGYASLYNHSNNCNVEYFLNGNVAMFLALRNIKAGEELTIHYGWDEEVMKEAGIIEDAV
jgi:SET domain-containing protein